MVRCGTPVMKVDPKIMIGSFSQLKQLLHAEAILQELL
jgi:hypothetical protein